MSAAALAAVITAATGLIAAVAALVRAWRSQSVLADHLQEHAALNTRAARQQQASSDDAQ